MQPAGKQVWSPVAHWLINLFTMDDMCSWSRPEACPVDAQEHAYVVLEENLSQRSCATCKKPPACSAEPQSAQGRMYTVVKSRRSVAITIRKMSSFAFRPGVSLVHVCECVESENRP